VALGPAAPGAPPGVESAVVRARVTEAAARQRSRYRGWQWCRDARVPAGALPRAIPLDSAATDALREVAERPPLGHSWGGHPVPGGRPVTPGAQVLPAAHLPGAPRGNVATLPGDHM